MFRCGKNQHCCSWEYADRVENIEEDCRDCGNLYEVGRVVHGKWINSGTYDAHKQPIYMCSACNGEVADYYIKKHKYCLHCGARMETK